MTASEIFDDLQRGWGHRKYSAGLLMAMIDFVQALGAFGGVYKSMDEFYAKHPRQLTVRQRGSDAVGPANTLIVSASGERPLSLRPFYNKVDALFRVTLKRFDYPHCPGHATAAWADYTPWLLGLFALAPKEARELREKVEQFVLEQLPSHAVAVDVIEPLPRPFSDLIGNFDLKAYKGEKNGACLQGVVYALLRADSPHLNVDVSKVGAGSKRLQRVGDVDCWGGKRLIISAESKSYDLSLKDAKATAPFCGEVRNRKALGFVFALTIAKDAREFLISEGVKPLAVEDIEAWVDLWDPLKQKIAFDVFEHYVHHVEKNAPLMKRFAAFKAKLAAQAKKPA